MDLGAPWQAVCWCTHRRCVLQPAPNPGCALIPQLDFEPTCGFVSSPAPGPVSLYPWLGSPEGPWTWFIPCLVWGCWRTLSSAPFSVWHHGQTVPGSVRSTATTGVTLSTNITFPEVVAGPWWPKTKIHKSNLIAALIIINSFSTSAKTKPETWNFLSFPL